MISSRLAAIPVLLEEKIGDENSCTAVKHQLFDAIVHVSFVSFENITILGVSSKANHRFKC
jgi:hypothetical protein